MNAFFSSHDFFGGSLLEKWVPGPRAFLWKSPTKNGVQGPRASFLEKSLLKISARPQGISWGAPTKNKCQAPGHLFWKPSTKNGCQAPGHFLQKAPTKKWVPGPRAFFREASIKNGWKAPGHPFLETKNKPKTVQKSPENPKKYPKRYLGKGEKQPFFWTARMPLLKVDPH